MFHINNDYSVGVADHDGDMGVFVMIDLLNSFKEKKNDSTHIKIRSNNTAQVVDVFRPIPFIKTCVWSALLYALLNWQLGA